VATVCSATSYVLANLAIGTEYYVVVRASDGQGHHDDNRVELHAKPQPDTAPPTFAGVVNASPSSEGGKIVLSWSAASDDLTSPAAITYVAYGAEADPVVGPNPLGTVVGATTLEVSVPKPLTPYRFVVRAQDASGNVDANTKEVVSIAGADTTAPSFGGCTAATATATNAVELSWNAGHDNVTPDNLLAYDLRAYKTPGPHGTSDPADAQASFTGATKGTVSGLQANTTYYFTCRARDLSGNVGGNPADTIAKTPADNAPPTFDGATAIVLANADSYSGTVYWVAASDFQSPPSAITYNVYTASKPGGELYGVPPAAKVTGQTSATLLFRPGETTYVVVRAVDEAQNSSTKLVELSVTPKISYDYQIQPIFTASCVPGCHTLNQKTYNPILADPVSYTFIISDGVVKKGDPTTSTLYLRMASQSSPMPPSYSSNPKPTQADIKRVYDWITQGAPGPLGLAKPPGY
jgi:hypothetical protein